jgi:lysophospholipid acyltransferase (LPLAT)-like uncharacterized protein
MNRLASSVVTLLARGYRAWCGTFRYVGCLPDGSVIWPGDFPQAHTIFAFCERDVLAISGSTAVAGLTALVAHGRDGDWASVALQAIGCQVVRGSSRRGGLEAFIALAEALDRSSRPAGIVVDGPLGPSGVAKKGAVALGVRTGRPVCPVAAAARHQLVIGTSWSRIYLPLPFSRVAVVAGEMLSLSAPAQGADVKAATALLTERLARARQQAIEAVRSPKWTQARKALRGRQEGQ